MMGVIEGFGDALQDPDLLRKRVRLAAGDQGRKVLAAQEFLDDVGGVALHPGIEISVMLGMVEAAGELGLAEETRVHFGAERARLDRDLVDLPVASQALKTVANPPAPMRSRSS